jgi:hypothetical protein
MYDWMMPAMPWLLAMRWATMMIAPPSAGAPSAEIIPFPPRPASTRRRISA